MIESPQPTILAVDDESIILRMFPRLLGDVCNVLTAETLEKALEMIDQKREKIQLLITDIGLTSSEGMEGLQVLTAAKQAEIKHRFGMSGRDLHTDEEGDLTFDSSDTMDLECLMIQAGAQKIFQKPDHMITMMRLIRETLSLPEKNASVTPSSKRK